MRPSDGTQAAADPARILLISGSLQAQSTNTALLRTLAVNPPPGVHAELCEGMGALPHFNPDCDPVGGPVAASVGDLRAQLGAAEALMFCVPTYAAGLPGAFANLLDWAVGGRELYAMPVAWLNVTGKTARGGGAGAHEPLQAFLVGAGSIVIHTACIRLPLTCSAVGADGLIADAGVRALALETLAELGRAAVVTRDWAASIQQREAAAAARRAADNH